MRSAFCMTVTGIAALPLMETLPFTGKGAQAAEGATGVFLLGSHGTNAGITPPPGVYFQNDTYFYSGKIGGGTTLPTGGLLVAHVSATSWINLPITLWATPVKLFGGDLAFSLTTPFGEPRVNATRLVNSPRFGPIGDVQNRMLGTAGYLTVALPLMVGSGSEIAAGKVIKAKF